EITVTFDDFYVLTAEDQDGEVDAFVLNWNEEPTPPPYYVRVDDRRFGLASITFLVRCHGAALPRWLRAEEAEGHLTLFVERDERLLAYVHDPNAETEEDEPEAGTRPTEV